MVYENLLAEEFGNHLNDKLQKIAKKKAKKMCKPFIESIKQHEGLEGGGDPPVNISEVWKTVSASDFFMKNTSETGKNHDIQQRTE